MALKNRIAFQSTKKIAKLYEKYRHIFQHMKGNLKP